MILYNNRKIEFGQFPNGEVNLKHLKIDPQDLNHVVTLKYEDDSDLFRLLLVRRALKVPATLRITYVPYSRMDRESETYTFSLKTFCEFINSMKWDKVVIYEPHSDVTPALLDRVQVVNVTGSDVMYRYIRLAVGTDYQYFYPDAGAQKRYSHANNELVGFKKRDFATGKIIEQQVIGECLTTTAVIMDDLCSKGGTFILAAEKLRDMGFQRVILVVAHCENTIYEGEVLSGSLINKVITTESILDPETRYPNNGKLKIIPLSEFKWNFDELRYLV